MSGIARRPIWPRHASHNYSSFCLLPGTIGGGRAVRFIRICLNIDKKPRLVYISSEQMKSAQKRFYFMELDKAEFQCYHSVKPLMKSK